MKERIKELWGNVIKVIHTEKCRKEGIQIEIGGIEERAVILFFSGSG